MVHRRTLVTAGLILLINYNLILNFFFLNFILIVFGLITIFFSRVISLSEEDLKKVVALRTLSQIGFSIIILGLNLNYFSLLHLIRHAFFKSCLFIQIGILIYFSYGQQDGRYFSGLNFFFYLILFQIFLNLFCLCGLFFRRGMISKDLILEFFFFFNFGILFYLFFFFSIFMTFFYSYRLFNGLKNFSNSLLYFCNEFNLFFISLILIFFSLFGIYFFNKNFLIIINLFLFFDILIPLIFIILFFILRVYLINRIFIFKYRFLVDYLAKLFSFFLFNFKFIDNVINQLFLKNFFFFLNFNFFFFKINLNFIYFRIFFIFFLFF